MSSRRHHLTTSKRTTMDQATLRGKELANKVVEVRADFHLELVSIQVTCRAHKIWR